MNNKVSHRTARRRLAAVAVAVASLAVVDGVPVSAAAGSAAHPTAVVEATRAVPSQATTSRATVTVTGTVLNNFVRDCSRVTRRCTRYWQTNGPYNPSVGSRYTTRWVWRLIW